MSNVLRLAIVDPSDASREALKSTMLGLETVWLEAECSRLLGLGASRLQRHEPAPPLSHGFIVMSDPEGNEFCLD